MYDKDLNEAIRKRWKRDVSYFAATFTNLTPFLLAKVNGWVEMSGIARGEERE
jgi:hypothetical protein